MGFTSSSDADAEAVQAAQQREKKKNRQRLALLGMSVSGIFFLMVSLSGGLVAGAPIIAAAFAWDRVSNLFDDHDWKNAVQRVATFQLDAERENLALYKPLYVNGKKVSEQDNTHWLNFGKTNATIYRPPTGKSTYTFDLGKELIATDVLLVMACKECAVWAVTSEDNPPDPKDPSKLLTPDEVGAYYTPTQNFPDNLNKTGRKAATNNILSFKVSVRYVTLFLNNKDADCYLVQLAVYPPGTRANVLHAGSPVLGADYTSVYQNKVGSALNPSSPGGSGSGSGSGLMTPAKPVNQVGQNVTYYGPLADADDNDHLALYPLVSVGNSGGAATTAVQAGTGSLLDDQNGYRKIYLGWKLHPSSLGKLQQIGIRWASSWSPGSGSPGPGPGGTPTATPMPTPTPDGGFGSVPTPTPGGPTPGSSPSPASSSPGAFVSPTAVSTTPPLTPTPSKGSGNTNLSNPAAAASSYYPYPSSSSKGGSVRGSGLSLSGVGAGIAIPAAKGSVGVGRATRSSSSFSADPNRVNSSPPSSASALSASPLLITSTSVVLPSPPSASDWKLYFLNSQDASDKALLDALFGSGAGADTVAGVTLPDNRLLHNFNDPSQTFVDNLAIPVGDVRDTLVFVFEGSNYQQELQSLAGGAATAGGNTSLIPTVPGQLTGLPPDWLSPAEIYAYEKPPLPPTSPPQSATSSSSGPGYNGPRGGQFDIRYGSITADRIEQILQDFPYTGITPGGLPAGDANPPRTDGRTGKANLLTGKGQFFVDMGKKYGINPTYALAMARKESSLFTTGVILYNANTGHWGNNGYGITFDPGKGEGGWLPDKCLGDPQILVGTDNHARYFCEYGSIEDSIEDYFGLLSEGYAGGKLAGGRYGHLTTIDQIIAVYAPSSDGNNTQQYIDQIKSWVSDWQTDPNTGPTGNPVSGPVGNLGPVPAINQYDCSQYNGTYPCGTWANSTCGPTSATMVINWLSGQSLKVADTLVYAAGNGVSPEGTYGWAYLNQMQSVFNFTWRQQAYGSTDEYLNGLKDLTGAGQPVIANIVGSPYTYGHFFVVVSYNVADNSFTINDPANVTQPGNPPGVIQRWPAPKLAEYLSGRLGGGYPAIVITPITPVAVTPSPSPPSPTLAPPALLPRSNNTPSTSKLNLLTFRFNFGVDQTRTREVAVNHVPLALAEAEDKRRGKIWNEN